MGSIRAKAKHARRPARVCVAYEVHYAALSRVNRAAYAPKVKNDPGIFYRRTKVSGFRKRCTKLKIMDKACLLFVIVKRSSLNCVLLPETKHFTS